MTTSLYDLSVIERTNHHPAMGELVDTLCHRTGQVNRDFFQAEVAYFLGLVPSCMRAKISSPERGEIPINIYSIALATSGFGKGHSVSLMEDVIGEFRDDFMETTFHSLADQHLFAKAIQLAATKGTDENVEKEALDLDFKKQGHAPFLFDSGTGPAVKQLRYKLLLAGCGAINFQMDEIGSNLQGNAEVINVLLELYDLGRVKTKLVKNTAENERGLDIVGATPANCLMFGTTSKLFDGSKTEEEFYSFLETGYARRCFFGMGKSEVINGSMSPNDLYDSLVNKNRSKALERWRGKLAKFADPRYFDQTIDVPKPVGVELIAYRLQCEAEAFQLPEHEVIRKAELSHRYFKALKLAGVYAFLDESPVITSENLRQAIKVAEESGQSFKILLNRERNFVRLAKYVAEGPENLTHADLVEDLPFYPTSSGARREIMDLAMAWGVGNHVVITKKVVQSVEFFSGSSLVETNLDKLSFSYSDHFAYDYSPERQSFENFQKLLAADGFHWCNHTFEKEHRSDENTKTGFNMLVVDVDGGVSLDSVHELLADYTFITSTTKSHTEDDHRFRLIMPTNFELHLDKEDYRDFMKAFLLWLPFASDPAAEQRSKKWLTNPNTVIHAHKGHRLIDVLPFIPKTKQNGEYMAGVADLGRLEHLERWFLSNMDVGNRNNHLLNYAMMLFEAGAAYQEVESKVLDLNSRTGTPLKKDEIMSTVLKSVASKY